MEFSGTESDSSSGPEEGQTEGGINGFGGGDCNEDAKVVLLPHLDTQELEIVVEDEEEGEFEEPPSVTITLRRRWEVIQEQLEGLKATILDSVAEGVSDPYLIPDAIKACIQSYNPKLRCNFQILENTLVESFPTEQFESTIVFMTESALSLPDLFPKPIPLLKNGDYGHSFLSEDFLQLSKEQICCILANAFFCTFPGREKNSKEFEFELYPRINFTELFNKVNCSGWRSKMGPAKIQKIRCFLNYFSRMEKRFSNRRCMSPVDLAYVTFERRRLDHAHLPKWKSVHAQFSGLNVYEKGSIEDSKGRLQIDFANKFVGGGTLGDGAAMEEIRFACSPELVAAQLFTKCLDDLDSLWIHGFERYSKSRGYLSTFEFLEDEHDATAEFSHLAVMDAVPFPRNSFRKQLEEKWLERELNKCLSAFMPSPDSGSIPLQIASGKWGCGVFNGNPLLKCLIQWMAASLCRNTLNLYTFGDEKLCFQLDILKQLITSTGCTVGQLYSIMVVFGVQQNFEENRFFEFVQRSLKSKEEKQKIREEEVKKPGKEDWGWRTWMNVFGWGHRLSRFGWWGVYKAVGISFVSILCCYYFVTKKMKMKNSLN